VGEISDVRVDGLTIRDSNRGIGLWQRTAGGALRDITIANVDLTTRYDSKPEFWGSGEPIFMSAMPPPRAEHSEPGTDSLEESPPRTEPCETGTADSSPPLITDVTFVNISAISENGALLSSLPAAEAPALVHVTLINVSIAIAKIGNTSRPQRDYRPARPPMPQTVAARVAGLTMEHVAGVEVRGGGVSFATEHVQPSWSLQCANVSASAGVRFDAAWRCRNGTMVAVL
jgi:hypothetical protein